MQRENWHLDKSVSISHLLTTAAMAMTLVGGWVAISERVARLETEFSQISGQIVSLLERQSARDARQDGELLEIRREVSQDLRDINAKLDRLIESKL